MIRLSSWKTVSCNNFSYKELLHKWKSHFFQLPLHCFGIRYFSIYCCEHFGQVSLFLHRWQAPTYFHKLRIMYSLLFNKRSRGNQLVVNEHRVRCEVFFPKVNCIFFIYRENIIISWHSRSIAKVIWGDCTKVRIHGVICKPAGFNCFVVVTIFCDKKLAIITLCFWGYSIFNG